MNIGDLNKRVTWQYKTRTPNGMGGFTETWVDAATVWAAIWPVSATEMAKAGSERMVVTHRIRIRFRRPFRADWRGKFGNRYFNIVGITNPAEANEYLDVMCKEAA